MIQTFIRAGVRQFAVLTCAAAVASTVSAGPMPDLRSDVAAMGLNPDDAVVDTDMLRRAAPKSHTGRGLLLDNGTFSNINGLASEINTIVSESRVADDWEVTNTVANAEAVTAQLYVTTGLVADGRLEVYANAGTGNCTPARPFASNPPLAIYNTTLFVIVGTGFGYPIREYDWSTAITRTCGKCWLCPIQIGRGSGRGFFAWSQAPHTNGCNAAWRSAFFGVPEWIDASGRGYNFDGAMSVYGTASGRCAGGGGGSCDLTPIEEKLDDETRFTDDDELAALQAIVESRASQASVDALEAKADAMQLQLDQIQNTLCDIVRLLHTPNGLRQATCNGVDYEWNGLQGGGGD